ncbi:hypothetical protein V2J09_024030 [Rumex salicifolius]
MTSLLRELVTVPNVGDDSSTNTSLPFKASSRATAIPTTPAPITTQSTFSLGIEVKSLKDRAVVNLAVDCAGIMLVDLLKRLRSNMVMVACWRVKSTQTPLLQREIGKLRTSDEARMVNPRRSSYAGGANQSSENSFQSQSLSFSSLLPLLKKPLAFPLLLSIFLFLTWLSLRIQYSSSLPSPASTPLKWSKKDDLNANLVRFLPSQLSKDKRGWLLNPVSAALQAGVVGGAINCISAHVGEIRPGGLRGNHRHYTCNETFIIWGARTKFRLENSQVLDKGYGEVTINEDEIAIAASPSGMAHALVNVDPVRTTYIIGCQDSIINSSASGFNKPYYICNSSKPRKLKIETRRTKN